MEPELSTPCGKGRKQGGKSQEEKRTSGRQDFALLMTGGLTPIMLLCIVHDTAHAHSTGNVHQESRDQAGASCARVGLQPPTSAAYPDGADGTDQALHRGHRGRMPAPFARACESGRSLRSRRRRAIGRATAGEGTPAGRATREGRAAGRRDPSRFPPSARPIANDPAPSDEIAASGRSTRGGKAGGG